MKMAETRETLTENYHTLLAKTRDLFVIGWTQSLVSWDMETKMPPRGIALRSEQLAQLSQIAYRMATDPEVGKLLDKIEKNPQYETLNEHQKRNVYLIRKN